MQQVRGVGRKNGQRRSIVPPRTSPRSRSGGRWKASCFNSCSSGFMGFFLLWTQFGPQFVQGVPVPTRGCVARDAKDAADFTKSHLLPDLQVDNGALLIGQNGERVRNVLRKFRGERRRVRREKLELPGSLSRRQAGRTTTNQIDERVMRGTEKIVPRFSKEWQRPFRGAQKNLLHEIAGVGLTASEVQSIRKDCPSMGIIPFLETAPHFNNMTHRPFGFVYPRASKRRMPFS